MPQATPQMTAFLRISGVILISLAALGPIAGALASDPPPASQVKGADRPHPDAAKINQANSRVIHAGPGTPIAGAMYTPPVPGKKEKKE